MSSKIIKEYPTQSLITQCPELSFVDQFLKKVLDLDLLKSLKSSLQDYQNAPFANARSMFEIIKLEEVQRKYPVWAKILSSLALSGTINGSLAELLISIIEHTEQLFESAPDRQASDYSLRKDGELDS